MQLYYIGGLHIIPTDITFGGNKGDRFISVINKSNK